MIEAPTAPLTAALIRRGSFFLPEEPIRFVIPSALAEDIRTFAVAWAAGFAFFLAFVV